MDEKVDKIYNYCFKILSFKPYSEFEIRKKIRGRFKNLREKILNEVLEKLKELKYVNDEEFAENYINYRTKISPRGKFLLKQELLKKGIEGSLIEQTLDKINLDELDLAKQLVEHKTKSLKSFEPQKQKEKLMRFLQSRGFGYDVIKEVDF